MKDLISCVIFSLLAVAAYAEPEDAFPAYFPTDYSARGFTIQIDDLSVYVAQPGVQGSFDKGVLWGHDIFGPNSGRTYELVDRLANDTEYTVLLPDFFRGAVSPPAETYEWETVIKDDWENKLIPFLAALGINSVGTVGTCWGSYVVVHTSAYDLVNAGFAAHPYHPEVMADFGEDEEALYNDINAVQGAQYYFPTPGDSDTLRPGGLADNTLDTLTIYETEVPCTHGYFNRGNLDIPEVYDCVEYTYIEMVNFFAQYL